MAVNPPEGTPQIVPYLYYDDAGAAVDWLAKSFGFEVKACRRGPDGSVVHADLALGSGLVMIGPGMAPFHTRGIGDPEASVYSSLYVYVDDIGSHFATARASGAAILSEVQEMPFGDKIYTARDLEGQRWIFAEHVKDV